MPAPGTGNGWRSDEFVLSADEKASIQARTRRHPTLPPAPGRAMRVEHSVRARRRARLGSQKGWCGSKDAWSVADLYDEALNVDFVIYE